MGYLATYIKTAEEPSWAERAGAFVGKPGGFIGKATEYGRRLSGQFQRGYQKATMPPEMWTALEAWPEAWRPYVQQYAKITGGKIPTQPGFLKGVTPQRALGGTLMTLAGLPLLMAAGGGQQAAPQQPQMSFAQRWQQPMRYRSF